MAVHNNQPLGSVRGNPNHPALSGNVPSIIAYGNGARWQVNNGNIIASPTISGALGAVATPLGTGFDLNGSSSYLTYPAANVPTQEFTVLWGGIFGTMANFRGLCDCSSGANGWNIFESGTDTLFFSINGYGGATSLSGWTPGQFWHGAVRWKTGGEHAWFRNGIRQSTTTSALVPGTAINPLRVFNHYAGGTSLMLGSFAYFYLIGKWLDDNIIPAIHQNPWHLLEEDPEILYYPPASVGGPTAYTKSLGGVLTPSGSLVKQTQKIFLGSTTTVGALFKQTAKSYSGSATPAGALTKQAGKAVSGSSTPAGTITKQTSKPLAGTSTAAGALNKQTTKSFAGSTTPSGVASTMILFTAAISGSITVAGALSRMTLKVLTGSSTLSGAITKMTEKGLSASITLEGVLNRLTKKAFAGSITAAGVLTESYQVLKSLAGSITPTGVVTGLYIAFVAGVLKLLTMMGVGQ